MLKATRRTWSTMRSGIPAMLLALLFVLPALALATPIEADLPEWQSIPRGLSLTIPLQVAMPDFTESVWWETTSLDQNRNRIHDSLEAASGPINVGLSYSHTPTAAEIAVLGERGFSVNLEVPQVDALLLGTVDAGDVGELSLLEGVVMVERYGFLVFYGDVQTPAVKARNSSVYPEGAWDLGVSGKGVNIALTDTGVDDEHPGLVGKFVAGYDAVCYMHSDLECVLSGGRETDGSFNPDDGNQHGTACMGMASATGLEADGSQSEYYGSAPDARLIDVRIGSDVGAGPFENYLLEQEFYESAMNGVQWIIDNADEEWSGVNAENAGIDIISLSWGITSHESGGSDGSDMHSRILDAAVEAGVTPSVAAGNDGPSNDGFSGMGSSSLSVTVGATDDQNTVDRGDDTIASYSSRGPRRDNGDDNPYDELKPEVSAPGSNIVQAEGCYTSGVCSNFFDDASENSYSGRGSGTSYATPAVSGIIALIIEANPDLDPLQIKEVLKATAERRGEATYPDIDPFWNRDFGWGMVDAHAAVSLALEMQNIGIEQSSFSPYLQVHATEFVQDLPNGTAVISGKAWAQQGEIGAVQYSIDGGQWYQATYEDIEGLEPGQAFNWTISLDLSRLSSGNHTLTLRGLGAGSSDGMYSLPTTFMVMGKPAASESAMDFTTLLAAFAFVLLLGGLTLFFLARVEQPRSLSQLMEQPALAASGVEILDAEVLDAVLVTEFDAG